MPRPTEPGQLVHRVSRGAVVAAVALSTALTVAVPATSAPALRAAKPGLAGSPITLGRHLELEAAGADIVTDRTGTAYVGWISSTSTNNQERTVSLCVLPPGATACKGGVQSINSIGPSSASDLKLLIVHGTVTLVWFHDTTKSETKTHASEISEATVSAGGTLSAGSDVATAPSFGSLLDAEIGPDGNIWTIAYGSGLPKRIEVREGISNAPVIVKTPYSIGFASIAFAGSTPIIAITKDGAISQPAAFSYRPGSSWRAFKNVKGTWTVGTNLGLVATSAGVRLITEVGNADYWPVIAKWTGHGFSHRTLTGDRKPPGPRTHDTVTDASGRLADVSNVDNGLTVANLADTTHATVFRFSPHGTITSPQPQISTTPRGRGWVMWAVEDPAGEVAGDTLSVVPVRLAGQHRHVTKHGRHGSITVLGPASCLPADAITVGVSGHGKHGWRVSKRHLSLGGKTVHSSLNGASLKAGKSYTLTGSVTFVSGHSHATVKVALKFRSCPSP